VKILVADNDHDFLEVLSYWLHSHGYDVLRAHDGETALARWRTAMPVLVILDVGIPRVDGFEVCRRMSKASTAAVLFLSARDRKADEHLGLALGAIDFLRKPVHPRRLLAHVRATALRSDVAVHMKAGIPTPYAAYL